jgi:hypothetical protein
MLENLASLLIRYRRRHVFTEAGTPTGKINNNTTSCETTAQLLSRVTGRRFYNIRCQGLWKFLYTRNRCVCMYKVTQRWYTVLGAYEKLHTATISFFMSVCLSLCVCPSAWNDSAPNRRIFMKFDILIFPKISRENLIFIKNLIRKTGTLHECLRKFMIESPSVTLKMINVSEKCCAENQNTHFTFNNEFPKIMALMR